MAQDWKSHAVENIRSRHTAKLRELAEDAVAQAQYVLNDLDRGRVPRIRNLLDDAQQINARILALETMDEATAIYRAED